MGSRTISIRVTRGLGCSVIVASPGIPNEVGGPHALSVVGAIRVIGVARGLAGGVGGASSGGCMIVVHMIVVVGRSGVIRVVGSGSVIRSEGCKGGGAL
jgi:hypothetical protein